VRALPGDVGALAAVTRLHCAAVALQITVDDDAMTDSDKRVFTQPIALHMLARYMIKLYRVSFEGALAFPLPHHRQAASHLRATG